MRNKLLNLLVTIAGLKYIKHIKILKFILLKVMSLDILILKELKNTKYVGFRFWFNLLFKFISKAIIYYFALLGVAIVTYFDYDVSDIALFINNLYIHYYENITNLFNLYYNNISEYFKGFKTSLNTKELNINIKINDKQISTSSVDNKDININLENSKESPVEKSNTFYKYLIVWRNNNRIGYYNIL